MSTPRTLTTACPAKVNLALSIGPPRPDGLHPLASWMVALDFADTLTIQQTDAPVSRFDIVPAASKGNPQHTHPVPPVCIDWPIESDLAYRAHTLMQDHVGRPLPIELTLRKRIPTGAGLAGGSSNAAATLVGLNQLFNLNLDDKKLLNLAQQLGSDVAFMVNAVLGHPCSLVTGLGERIEPLPLAQPIHLVLIFPGFGCPTASVYQAFDRLHNQSPGDQAPDDAHIRALAQTHPLDPAGLFNDLAEPAFNVRPELREVRDHLQNDLHTPVHVTGSGSTLFIVAASHADAQRLVADAISANAPLAITATTLATQ